nr:hypothetical protein C5F59_38880 [Streptomyces sp. QL37]
MPWVRPYVRRDGTRVKGHSRWAAGGRREMSVVVMFGLAVVVLGNPSGSGSGSADGPDQTQRPGSTAVYPVTFPGTQKSTTTLPRPQPTVSYPIAFPETRTAPAPRSTVTYPIPWDRSHR